MFWILRLCFGEFCALCWDSHQENLNFCQIFVWDWFLWMICIGCWPLVAKRTCIKGRFHDVHALFHIVVHSMHTRCLIKCLLGIFSLVWTLMSTKIWSFSCFLIRNMFGSLVVYLRHFAPQCVFYALVMQCTLPPLAHTFATLVMH